MKELNNDMIMLLKKINECCIKIVEKENLNCKLKKIDCLKRTDFYNNYNSNLFYN